jgi:hypothetical protein
VRYFFWWQDGDILNIDVTVYLNGFHGDCSEMAVSVCRMCRVYNVFLPDAQPAPCQRVQNVFCIECVLY